jgi:hypothetical protein
MKKLAAFIYFIVLATFSRCEKTPPEALIVNEDVMDNELYDLITTIPEINQEGVINCIEFNYWFTIFVFDEAGNYVRSESIATDWEFSKFLGGLKEGERISLSYPIMGTFENGEEVEIRSNEELKAILDQCLLDEQQQQCEGALCQDTCYWTVENLQNPNDPYHGARFKIRKTGVTRFLLDDSVYLGSWNTFYIGEQLHINIYLNDEETVGIDWNLDWLLDYRTNDSMGIENGDTRYTLTRNCELSCKDLIFQKCELDDAPGMAQFQLNEYLVCLAAGYHDLKHTTYSFFESEEDAINNIQAITDSIYTNKENPQTLYYRMEAADSGDLLYISTFTLEAIDCE